jgi:23S rRNA pseudouridine2457 synthase
MSKAKNSRLKPMGFVHRSKDNPAMTHTLIFHKPYGVLPQFSDKEGRPHLGDYVSVAGVYPAGRLDRDSEGLMVLTSDGALQHKIAHPDHKMSKTYWVQVEGSPTQEDLAPMSDGLALKDGMTLPAKCQLGIGGHQIWDRNPPIRVRKTIPDTWLTLTLKEGRNRQVRRMCAHLGFPVLRLIRYRVGSWTLDGLAPGQWREV